MRTFLRLVPAGLAALLLGAHFLRFGRYGGVAAALALLALLFVPRAWAARAAQAGLALGALVWLRIGWLLVAGRRAAGAPHLRLAWILGAVVAVTVVAAVLLEGRARSLAARGPAPPG